jgi:hypothetical protein
MTVILQLLVVSVAVPGAIVAVGEIRRRRARTRSVARPRRREIDFSVRLRIRRR